MMKCINEYLCVRSLLSGIRLCVCACLKNAAESLNLRSL